MQRGWPFSGSVRCPVTSPDAGPWQPLIQLLADFCIFDILAIQLFRLFANHKILKTLSSRWTPRVPIQTTRSGYLSHISRWGTLHNRLTEIKAVANKATMLMELAIPSLIKYQTQPTQQTPNFSVRKRKEDHHVQTSHIRRLHQKTN